MASPAPLVTCIKEITTSIAPVKESASPFNKVLGSHDDSSKETLIIKFTDESESEPLSRSRSEHQGFGEGGSSQKVEVELSQCESL